MEYLKAKQQDFRLLLDPQYRKMVFHCRPKGAIFSITPSASTAHHAERELAMRVKSVLKRAKPRDHVIRLE